MYLEWALLSAQKINSVAVRFTLTRPSFQGSREWNRRRKPPMTGPLSASPSAWPPCRYFPSRIAPRPPSSIRAGPSEDRNDGMIQGFILKLLWFVLFIQFQINLPLSVSPPICPLFPDCALSRGASSPAKTSSAAPSAATAPRQSLASSRHPKSATTTEAEAASCPCRTEQAMHSPSWEARSV